jgi:hypothetical protein
MARFSDNPLIMINETTVIRQYFTMRILHGTNQVDTEDHPKI